MIDLHVSTYQSAYQNITGRDISREQLVSRFGKAERRIHEEIFEEAGIPTYLIERVIQFYRSHLMDNMQNSNIEVLPGVKDFLEGLKRQEEYIGIITGNSREVAEAILKKTGLYDFFSIFSCGDNADNRSEIVKNAVDIARKRRYESKRVVVLGDSPYDTKAGKSVGAFTIAVATGPNYKMKDLTEADLVLENFQQYHRIFEELKDK